MSGEFNPGPGCQWTFTCKLLGFGRCQEAAVIRMETGYLESGMPHALDSKLPESQCQHPDAVAAREVAQQALQKYSGQR